MRIYTFYFFILIFFVFSLTNTEAKENKKSPEISVKISNSSGVLCFKKREITIVEKQFGLKLIATKPNSICPVEAYLIGKDIEKTVTRRVLLKTNRNDNILIVRYLLQVIAIREGKFLWKYEGKYDRRIIPLMCCDVGENDKVIVDQERVYFTEQNNRTVVLDSRTGKKIWYEETGDPKTGTESRIDAITPDSIIVSSNGAEFGGRSQITAYDKKKGNKIWQTYLDGSDKDVLIDLNEATQLGKRIEKDSFSNPRKGDSWKLPSTETDFIGIDAQKKIIFHSTETFSNLEYQPNSGKKDYKTIWARDLATGKVKWVFKKPSMNQYTNFDDVMPNFGSVNISGRTDFHPVVTLPKIGADHLEYQTQGIKYKLDNETGNLISTEIVGSDEGPYWNSWFEAGGEPKNPKNLEINRSFTFIMDLSPFSYQQKSSSRTQAVKISPELVQRIKDRQINSNENFLKIKIRSQVIGADAVKAEELDQELIIVFDKLKPRKLDTDVVYPYLKYIDPKIDTADGIKFKNKKFSNFRKVMRIATIKDTPDEGMIPFKLKVKGTKEGCGAVVVTLWDEAGLIPLNSLVQYFRIGSKRDGDYCRADDPVSTFQSGFSSLLNSATKKLPVSAPKIAASFNLIEIGNPSEHKTVVMFVNANDPDKLLVWQTNRDTKTWLQTHIPRLLARAQKQATNPDGEKNLYAKLSEKVHDLIFSTDPNDDSNSAKKAFGILQNLVKKADQNIPYIYVRATDLQGKLLYLPLRLLSAGGADSKLKSGQIHLVQPLKYERFPSGAKRCIRPWLFALPKEIVGGKTDGVNAALEEIKYPAPIEGKKISWIKGVLDTIEKLTGFFKPVRNEKTKDNIELAGTSKPTNQTGLIMLAHQDKGILYTADKNEELAVEEMKSFSNPGGIAILIMCNASGVNYEDQKILNIINKQGFDTIITSSFQVDAKYGANLAAQIVKQIQSHMKNLQNKKTIPLVQLFDKAVKQTSIKLKQSKLDDMALEFQIFGDYGVELCAP